MMDPAMNWNDMVNARRYAAECERDGNRYAAKQWRARADEILFELRRRECERLEAECIAVQADID